MSAAAPDPAAWIGRTQRVEAVLDPWPAAALTAALGRDDPPRPGEPLPPFWHQLYALPAVHAGMTGPDGHERLGAFLPALPLARRMWAGGRLRLERPLRVGERMAKTSTVRAVTPKEGRQGPLVFVLVEHRIETADGLALVEEQDLVYRQPTGAPGTGASRSAGPGAWQRVWRPDPVLLFRYSALTYNGHRIHYDADYARGVEGYPGLVVHGPLLATLLLDLVRRERPQACVRAFRFRALAPLFVDRPLAAQGDPEGEARARLWVTGPDGLLAMEASAELA